MSMIKPKFIPSSVFLVLCLLSGCDQAQENNSNQSESNSELEKQAILDALHNETKAAFSRDYPSWKTHWVHRSSISKTYMNFSDTTFSEMTSWKEVDDFVRTYIEEHPEPVPPPAQPKNVDVKLYGSGAWVSYEMQDEVFGRKRETRLMEKEEGQWKIAGMHTTIYGF